MFLRSDPDARLQLAKRMANLQWNTSHHVDSFLADLADIRAAHQSTGVTISENDIFVKLLSCLPAEFDVERSLMAQWPSPDMAKARNVLIQRQFILLKRKRGEEFSTTPTVEGTSFHMSNTPPQQLIPTR
jgi:hypothetical protein